MDIFFAGRTKRKIRKGKKIHKRVIVLFVFSIAFNVVVEAATEYRSVTTVDHYPHYHFDLVSMILYPTGLQKLILAVCDKV